VRKGKNKMLVDSHCHLNMMADDPAMIIATARAEGVGLLLNVSVDIPTFATVLATAQAFDGVYASVGIHPNSDRAYEADSATLVALAQAEKVIAIGETGLDYFRSQGDLEWQRARFRYHIRAARDCAKPLIIHCRDAAADTVRILRQENAAEVGGIMHCFVDDWDTAQAAMDMGFLISFSGIVTFKTATALKQIATQIPLTALLIETDAPYLAPVPHRGKPNHPAFVRHIAEHIAILRDLDTDTIAHTTCANFMRLFPTTATTSLA
jgi:TatD DNase family protein